MEFANDGIRLARKCGERLLPFLSLRISPFGPLRCNPEELTIQNRDLIFRLRYFLPFDSKNDEAGTIQRFEANLSFQKFAFATPSDLTLKEVFQAA